MPPKPQPPDGALCLQALPGDFRVRLGVGGPCVRVHRVVLGCRSGFFACLFRSGRRMAEAGANEVVLKVRSQQTGATT